MEVVKSNTKAPTDSVSGEGLLPESQTAVLALRPYLTEGMRELSGVSFTKKLNPSMRLHAPDLITSKYSTSKCFHFGD